MRDRGMFVRIGWMGLRQGNRYVRCTWGTAIRNHGKGYMKVYIGMVRKAFYQLIGFDQKYSKTILHNSAC
jgi:hypothetical protein